MISHIWTVLCERISIDRETNLVSYLTCIEEITAAQLPAIHPLLSLGTLWQSDAPGRDVLKFKVVLVSPTGEEKDLIQSEDYVLEREKHRANINLFGIGFALAGTHHFKLMYRQDGEWRTAADIPLKVIHKPAAGTMPS